MKERKVVFSPEARADLIELYELIAQASSPKIAIGYVERLEDFCAGFCVAAERGQQRDDVRPGLRTTGFERRVTVAFTVDAVQVVILRLFYGGQDWEQALSC